MTQEKSRETGKLNPDEEGTQNYTLWPVCKYKVAMQTHMAAGGVPFVWIFSFGDGNTSKNKRRLVLVVPIKFKACNNNNQSKIIYNQEN